jgi:predicted dinucleotide-binding enzyme
MTTAILGLGNMGKGLAQRLAGKTDLILGVRDSAAAADFAKTVKADVASYQDAVAKADIVVLALPYDLALDAARTLPLAGKVVVDMTNPLKPDYSGMSLGFTTSAAEEIAKLATGAKVVKAFNTVFAALFAKPVADTKKVAVFIAGDDETAVNAVADLTEQAGFLPERCGGLDAARLIEPVGMLNIRLGFGLGKGVNVAPVWIAV